MEDFALAPEDTDEAIVVVATDVLVDDTVVWSWRPFDEGVTDVIFTGTEFWCTCLDDDSAGLGVGVDIELPLNLLFEAFIDDSPSTEDLLCTKLMDALLFVLVDWDKEIVFSGVEDFFTSDAQDDSTSDTLVSTEMLSVLAKAALLATGGVEDL